MSRTSTHAPRMAIATNNGDIGGGEVMLLHIAEALRDVGIDVLVIGPSDPGDLVRAAEERGFDTDVLPASGRQQYMLRLLAWRLRHRRIPLWCNGLVPSFATSGIGPRMVHLHMLPRGLQRIAARLATLGAHRVLVPSQFMASRLPGAAVIENWTDDIPVRSADRRALRDLEELPQPVRVGFLGRLTRDKGVDVLAQALELVPTVAGREVRLVLAGENRFGSAEDDRAIGAALLPLAHRIDQMGWAERDRFFDEVDLVVVPSAAPESFGLVAAEAMCAGVPFVITDAGALPEVAGPEHPWVARSADVEGLAQALRAALTDRDQGERTRSARARWSDRFSPMAGTERVRRLLAALDTPKFATAARGSSARVHTASSLEEGV